MLAVALDQTYDYLVPEGLELEPGCFVLVPFGPQSRIGVVWDKSVGGPVGEPGKPVDPKKLKTITARLDVPPLPALTLRFAEWIAKYTLAPLGMTVRMMMSARAVFEPTKPRFGVTVVEGAPEPPRMTPARKRALEIAADGAIRAKAALALAAECSSGVVDGLVASGNLVEVAIPDKRPPLPDPHHRVTEFETEQAAAVHALRSAVDGGNFSTTLLDGVTGSGKTEVYFEAVARTLERGQQAVIMLPEIALTDQFMRRFQGRFGCAPVEWHSALSGPERGRVWKQAATGEARVIVGARSALFLPFADLGLIIVDEEHDAGFKQDDRVHYQARDMAVVRGNLGGFPVILASATPSIETHVNARTGRYRHVDPAGTLFRRLAAGRHRHRSAADAARQRQVAVAGAGRRRGGDDGCRAAVAAVPQPARVRAADAVPLVRASHRVPAVHRLAGRAPLPRQAALPPLRLLAADAGEVPQVRRAGRARRLRSGRGARRRGGGGALPARRASPCCRPISCPASPRCAR